MGAPDARLQHAAAPDGDSRRLRHVMHAFGFAKPAYATQFNVDDAAGAQLDRLLGMVRGDDALIQAKRGV